MHNVTARIIAVNPMFSARSRDYKIVNPEYRIGKTSLGLQSLSETTTSWRRGRIAWGGYVPTAPTHLQPFRSAAWAASPRPISHPLQLASFGTKPTDSSSVQQIHITHVWTHDSDGSLRTGANTKQRFWVAAIPSSAARSTSTSFVSNQKALGREQTDITPVYHEPNRIRS